MRIGPDDPGEREALEIQNLGRVEEYIKQLKQTRPDFSISEDIVLVLHYLTVQGLYGCAGNFRSYLHRVTVSSDTFEPVPPYEVRMRTRDLIEWYRQSRPSSRLDKYQLATTFFHEFLRIHPFCGGNGRVSRALLSLILAREGLLDEEIGYAPIHYSMKLRNDRYLECLQEADRGNDEPLKMLIATASVESQLDPIVDALKEEGALAQMSETSRRFATLDERVKMNDSEFFRSMTQFLREAPALLGLSDFTDVTS